MVKKILNYHEGKTHILLKRVCERYGSLVFAKVRVADVLRIKRTGISDREFRFALISHFDFVVANSAKVPLFAVEFDGPYHRTKYQTQRDRIKDNLCNREKFPLLRINTNYLLDKYRNMDLLTWIIEYWFLSNILYEQQKKGYLPEDEPFDPTNFLTLPEKEGAFPMWLSLEPRTKIKALYKKKIIIDPIPSIIIGSDKNNNYHGISYIRIDDKIGTYVRSGIRSQLFPIPESEILEEILVFELYDNLKSILDKESQGRPLYVIDRLLRGFGSRYKNHWMSILCHSPKAIG